MYVRLGKEHPELAADESTLRDYVHQRKIALGLLAREILIPQSYAWGSKAQSDWHEADAELGGERAGVAMAIERGSLLPYS